MKKGSHCSEEMKYKLRIQRENTIEDFWKKVDIRSPNDCWEWKGNKLQSGYGRINICKINYRAHVLAYKLITGEILNNLLVCHTCDNKLCCNPNHLYLGNNQDNMNDMISRKRSCVGEKNPTNKLTKENVLKIREMFSTGKYTYKQLANTYNVTSNNIRYIIIRKTWKHI